MSTIERKDIERAYKLLKSYYYYDNNMTLNTKIAIAEYECSNILGNKNWAEEFKEKYLVSSEKEKNIEEKIKKISVVRVVKSIEPEKNIKNYEEKSKSYEEKFQLLTNKPNIEFDINYNYLIDAPVEIHILSMLWIMKEGYLLDLKISDDIYGSRLEINKEYECIDKYKKNVFKLYHKQYSLWRDKALKRVSDIINKEDSNAVLINLDIKRYYYNIELEKLYKNILNVNENLDTFLFSCIQKINKFYNKKIRELVKNEGDIKEIEKNKGLPIGLLSSQVLANFYLIDFDNEVSKLLPDYYGRYVDDVLIIFKDRENYKDKDVKLEKYYRWKIG